VKAVDQHAVEVDLSQALCNWNDFWSNIEHYSQVGALFIELASRRRLRLNGTISRPFRKIATRRSESYPTVQNIFSDDTSIFALIALHLNYLSNGRTIFRKRQQLISSADTFFVASAHPSLGVDASHRVAILVSFKLSAKPIRGSRLRW